MQLPRCWFPLATSLPAALLVQRTPTHPPPSSDQQLCQARAPQPPQSGVLGLPAILCVWAGCCLVRARPPLHAASRHDRVRNLGGGLRGRRRWLSCGSTASGEPGAEREARLAEWQAHRHGACPVQSFSGLLNGRHTLPLPSSLPPFFFSMVFCFVPASCTTQEDQLLDLLMLRLRLSDGLDLQQLQHTFGAPVVATLLPVIAEHMQHGLMQVVGVQQQQQQPYGEAGGGVEACVAQLRSALAEEGRPCGVRLTDPAGFLLSNDVIAGLFAALSPDLLQPPGTLSK